MSKRPQKPRAAIFAALPLVTVTIAATQTATSTAGWRTIACTCSSGGRVSTWTARRARNPSTASSSGAPAVTLGFRVACKQQSTDCRTRRTQAVRVGLGAPQAWQT